MVKADVWPHSSFGWLTGTWSGASDSPYGEFVIGSSTGVWTCRLDNAAAEGLTGSCNSELGNAAVYYDANPSAAGGAVLVTELDNISFSGLANVNSGDFVFI